ncbi:MAG TPA: superinfection immunity protein [Terracidiphilus sp.]|jgi:hypothetical protein|nr:superinfection immunity protein [Terracidiphilus sp.]
MFHLGGFLFMIGLYFLPSFIASARHVSCRGGIVLLNLFLGWTFFGWVAALIWAIAAPAPYFYYVPPPYPPYR